MADQKVYFAESGVPKTGLTLAWDNIKKVSDGTNYTPQPAFTEIGGGWYKFPQPDTDEDLTGVVDGSATLTEDTDRYLPVDITPDDFGMTDLLDAISQGKQVLDPDNDILTLYRRDGVTVLTVFDLTKPLAAVDAYITRTPQ